MLYAISHLYMSVRIAVETGIRAISVGGPVCHATGSAEKAFICAAYGWEALSSGDAVGAALAAVWLAANLALAIEAAATACAHAQKVWHRPTK